MSRILSIHISLLTRWCDTWAISINDILILNHQLSLSFPSLLRIRSVFSQMQLVVHQRESDLILCQPLLFFELFSQIFTPPLLSIDIARHLFPLLIMQAWDCTHLFKVMNNRCIASHLTKRAIALSLALMMAMWKYGPPSPAISSTHFAVISNPS